MTRFFIVGCPRSGTTLLQQMLHTHDDVAVTPETHFVRRIANHWQGDGMLERFVDEPGVKDAGIDAAAIQERLGGRPEGPEDLLQGFMDAYGEKEDAGVVGEKTPNHLLHMQRIERLVPGARFLHLVRDPRAVASSWREVPWSTGSLRGDAAIWRYYEHTARRRPPEAPVMRLRYEDLVREPEPTLRRVCRFLGIDFQPSMLAFDRQPRGVDLGREPWKARVGSPLDPARLDAWRQDLDEREVRIVEGAAWPYMARHGYSPQTGRLRRGGEVARHTAWRAWNVARRRR